MKKAILLGLTVLGLLALAACNKESGQNQPGVQGEQKDAGKKENKNKKTHKFVPEDFIPGGGSEVLQTEKGYYYLNNCNIRYVDTATGNDIYLCNKPECRHDGNEFCVATNDKYQIYAMRLYNGKLLAVASEVTETELVYKLLLIEPDGSAMDELVTYMTMAISGQVLYGMPDGFDEFQIHRNWVMLPFSSGFSSDDVVYFSDTSFYGTALYNLDTGELVYLDEEPFGKENGAVFSIQGYKDWIYYCKSEEGKARLHRYNLTDGTDESYTLFPSFAGVYGIKDENTVVYVKCNGTSKVSNEICLCHTDTGENETAATLMRMESGKWLDGTEYERERMVDVLDMTMDDTYIYVFEQEVSGERLDADTGEWVPFYDSYIQIYDHDLNKVVEFDFADAVVEAMPEMKEGPITKKDGETVLYSKKPALYFLNGEAYCFINASIEGDIVYWVYRCKQSDLLAGTPELELVYKTHKQINK